MSEYELRDTVWQCPVCGWVVNRNETHGCVLCLRPVRLLERRLIDPPADTESDTP